MARAVLGGVKQQAEHVRRQPGAADLPLVQQRHQPSSRAAGRTPARSLPLTPATSAASVAGGSARLLPSARANARCASRERLASRVGEQPIERAASVADVKADRCGAAGPLPDVLGGHDRRQPLEIFLHLDQRVHDRHQQRIEPGQRPALPRFCLLRHTVMGPLYCVRSSTFDSRDVQDYSPQLATLVKEPPSGDGVAARDQVRRLPHRLPHPRRPRHADQPQRQGLDGGVSRRSSPRQRRCRRSDALLDGEVAIVLPDGRTSFQALQNACAGEASAATLVYFVFDLLRLDGESVGQTAAR